MLLTRCPSCNTAFRITAELLKQASGQVRCGRCNHVFAAFAHLEEAQVAPDAHGIGSYAPPLEETSEEANDLAETSEHLALSFEADVAQAQASGPGRIQAQPVTADELTEIFDSDPARRETSPGDETLAAENQTLLATIDPDEPLDLELHSDGSQTFSESEYPVDDDSDFTDSEEIVMETAVDDDGALADDAPPSEDQQTDWPLADSPSSSDPAHLTRAEEQPVPPAITDDPAPDLDAFADPDPFRAVQDPEPEPWALASTALPADTLAARRRWWTRGSAVLTIILLLQVGHQFRNDLATNKALGPLVRAIYGGMALDLAPDWDVDQYGIDDWIATAEADESGQNSLTITATLSNRGPRDQPHPYVRLELKDRWDEPVGSRIFRPAEYMSEPPAPDALMAAGAQVPARMAVVDPGEDAYGFELDVCLPTASDQLRCANQKVF